MSRRAVSVCIGAALMTAVLWKADTAGAQAADIDDVYCALCHFEQGDEFVESIHYSTATPRSQRVPLWVRSEIGG